MALRPTQSSVMMFQQRSNATQQIIPRTESTERTSNMIKFLYQHKQRPIPTTDKHVIVTNCPHCVKLRKNSFAAYLDLHKGTYHCKTCKSKGRFPEFTKLLLKKMEPPQHNDYAILSASNVLSSSNNAKHTLTRSEADIDSYAENLIHDEATLQKIESEHHINKDTLQAFGVGITPVNDDTALCLTFPQTALTYKEEDGDFKIETVRLKLCDLDNPAHVVQLDPPTSGKESTEGLFGYQTASYQDDIVILTRREFDALAAHQATGLPAISIPSSNYQLQESVLPLLDRFSRIYLWLDDDVDGQIAAERFARKIGEHKCLLINTRQGELEGPINAHDALVAGKDLQHIVATARGIKHDQIVDFSDLREEVYNEVLHPEQTRGVQSKDLPTLSSITKGHRSGELTILTGPTGAGKTTIISQLSLDYCKSGVPTLWGSFEIMNKRLAKKMLYQFAEKDISLNPKEFDEIADRFEQLPLYFLKFFSSTAISDVLKACHHAVYAYDVRHIVLDNLQFMLSQQGGNSLDKWDLQDNAIAEIRNFATQQDVHITLVVHPRKDNGTHEELDIHSIFGSAKVTQEADNVIIIQKSREDRRSLDVKKNRFDGTLGYVPYKFDKETFKIHELSPEELHKAKNEKFKYGSTSVKFQRSK
ncbi:t7-like mitochondrial DNA helicase [Mucor ambiguus]|uniref:T7-like mitochondrial DNA helicase n=1 Tax=Mucor ambiguus TaxID=91626 RepID=A0A0C9MDG3_9FUNG|nr:t7-like mitochondrial DNA helicase [Mucor ambiguus]